MKTYQESYEVHEEVIVHEENNAISYYDVYLNIWVPVVHSQIEEGY